MNEIKKGIIRFLGYRIAKIIYNCSPEFEFREGLLRFNFQKQTVIIEKSSIQLNVTTNIYFAVEGNDQFSKSPFQFSVELAGRFDSESNWQEEWETNALAILFPYIRAIVSSISAQSGREPIILPTINLAQMFITHTQETGSDPNN